MLGEIPRCALVSESNSPLAPSRSLPPRDLNARVPRHHRRESICLSSSLNMVSVPPRLRATWSRSVGVTTRWMTAFLRRLRTRKSYRSSSVSWQWQSLSSGSSGLRLRIHLASCGTSGFSRGSIKPPANARPPSSPKKKVTKLWRAPYSSVRPSASAALTSVDGAEE